MKKRLLTALAGLVVVSLVAAGCGGSGNSSSDASSASSSTVSSEGTQKVGIGLIAPVSVLEENIDAFKEALAEEGIEAEYEEFNAQGQISNVSSIATRLQQIEPDLVYLVGTPLVESFAQHNSGEVPIVFGAMTDPISDHIVESLEHPGGDATGTSDKVPASLIYEVIGEALPEAKTVGVIGNTAESNTVVQIEELKEAAGEEGYELEERAVSNTGEVASAIRSLEGVDVLVIPTDNTVTSALATVAKTSSDLGIPTVELAGDTMAEEGFLIGLGVNYVKMGSEAGEQAAEIFGGTAPAEIPVSVGAEKELDVGVNLPLAKELGVTVPASLQQRAKIVVGK
jgi:putative tryptophan/tyrosine transport system substrate-binding protein